MNWDDLRFFLALVKAGTMAKAARELGVAQTTVARRIQALESTLRVRLLERDDSGLVPSPAGEEVLEAAQSTRHAVDQLTRRVLGLDERLSGKLRITTIDMIAVYDTALFRTFAERYPGVELELGITPTPQDLSRREADVAIRWTDSPPPYLVGRKLFRAEYALYGAQSIVDTFGDVPVTELPWLGWDPKSGARVTDAWMETHVPNARIAGRFDHAVALHAALLEGMGIAFVPCRYGDSFSKLRKLAPADPEFAIDLWALTHPDLRATARVRAFMTHAASYFVESR